MAFNGTSAAVLSGVISVSISLGAGLFAAGRLTADVDNMEERVEKQEAQGTQIAVINTKLDSVKETLDKFIERVERALIK